MTPLDIPIGIQDLTVLSVCAVAAFILWRVLRRSKPTGCPSCVHNPDAHESVRTSAFDR
ncbi:MAG: hypothetical protein Kow0074_19090 [Candidatus Zixiibacteriota bacterium]